MTAHLTRTEAELVALLVLADGNPICPLLYGGPREVLVYVSRLRDKGLSIPMRVRRGPTYQGVILAALPPDEHLEDILGILDEWRGFGRFALDVDPPLCQNRIHLLTPETRARTAGGRPHPQRACGPCYQAAKGRWRRASVERGYVHPPKSGAALVRHNELRRRRYARKKEQAA